VTSRRRSRTISVLMAIATATQTQERNSICLENSRNGKLFLLICVPYRSGDTSRRHQSRIELTDRNNGMTHPVFNGKSITRGRSFRIRFLLSSRSDTGQFEPDPSPIRRRTDACPTPRVYDASKPLSLYVSRFARGRIPADRTGRG
jgi:hypothetical protein